MPVVAMVSMTEDWEIMKTTTGGIIIIRATAAPAPALAMPAEEMDCITAVRVFRLSSYL